MPPRKMKAAAMAAANEGGKESHIGSQGGSKSTTAKNGSREKMSSSHQAQAQAAEEEPPQINVEEAIQEMIAESANRITSQIQSRQDSLLSMLNNPDPNTESKIFGSKKVNS